MLAKIIQNYREGELTHSLDASHIERWLSQFDEECQPIILNETLHVFKEWYFDQPRFVEYYNRIIGILSKKYSLDEIGLINKAVFISTQRRGRSQCRMVEKLSEIVNSRYGCCIKTQINTTDKIYVYIDDALFTGSHARKDLIEVLCQLPSESDLNVFYLVGATSGLEYSKKEIEKTANERNINTFFYQRFPIETRKYFKVEHDAAGSATLCFAKQQHFWPLRNVLLESDVKEYFDSRIKGEYRKNKYIFRHGTWEKDSGIFTTSDNRSIIEREFLKKGIIIAKQCRDNGLYPLGYNCWPSLGFGSFCATFMNISNTCPLVLWWGNIEKKGDILDCWYPLLPRRVNGETYDFEELAEEHIPNYSKQYYYNTCPDCGRPFGYEEDGGNGFCVECAKNH